MVEGGTVTAGGWQHLELECDSIIEHHCVPRSDLRVHIVGDVCPCDPVVVEGEPDHIVHRAWDGREDYESPAPGRPPRRRKH